RRPVAYPAGCDNERSHRRARTLRRALGRPSGRTGSRGTRPRRRASCGTGSVSRRAATTGWWLMKRPRREVIMLRRLRGHVTRLVLVVGGLVAFFYVGGAPIMFGT